MLCIFSGDDIAASRNAFTAHLEQIKSLESEIRYLNSLDDLIHSLQSISLFSAKKALILENVLSKATSRTALQKTLANNPNDVDICIWEAQTDPKLLKKSFPNARHFVSMLPTTLWNLLDSYAPGNLSKVITLQQNVLCVLEEPFVLYMLQRRLKELLVVSLSGKPPRLASWQIQNLSRQAMRWGIDPKARSKLLTKTYQKLCEIEFQTKSGTLAYPIGKALDICACFYLK